MRIAIGLEYLGVEFKGWQRQVGVRTVQACVEEALSRVADHSVSVVTAGRTDTAVHATGQVAHFDTLSQRSEYSWLRGVNTYLPSDISVHWVRPTVEEFHARFSAQSRCYRYVILNRPTRSAVLRGRVAWHCLPLRSAAMQAAAALLVGEHDFSAFRAAGCQAKSAVRRIDEFTVRRHGNWLSIDVRANAFLQHMVRNMVGVLVAVGTGSERVEWVTEVLAGRDRRQAGAAAPASGLYLTAVDYPAGFRIPPPPPPCRFW